MTVSKNRLFRPRAARCLARLLAGALCVPYLLTPVAALAGPPNKPNPPVNKNWAIDRDAWNKLLAMMAAARAEAALYQNSTGNEAEKHRRAARERFDEAAEFAGHCKRGEPEYDNGNLYPPGGPGPNNFYIQGVFFTPRLAYGYAKFEMGRLAKDPFEKRNDFSEAGRALYLNALPEATQGDLAKEYQLPAIQLIALLGKLEDLRGYLDKESNRVKFTQIVGEINVAARKFEEEKKKTITTLAQKNRVGSLLVQQQKDETPEKIQEEAANFLKEVWQTLADEIDLSKEEDFVLAQDSGAQFHYAFVSDIAPVSLIETVNGATKAREFLTHPSETRDAEPQTTEVKLQVDPAYASLAEKLHPGKIKPEQKERTVTWAALDEPMTAAITGGGIRSRLPEIANGAVALRNVKAGDILLVSVNNNPLAPIPLAADATTFSMNLAPFGRSATVSIRYQRKDKTEPLIGPFTLTSTAEPEAQVRLAADYGAFGLLLARYASFDEPTALKVNDAKYSLPPQPIVNPQMDSLGRHVYWLPIYSASKSATVQVNDVTAVASKQFAQALPVGQKTEIEQGLIGGLKLADAPQTLTPEQRGALLEKSEQPEIKPLLAKIYENVSLLPEETETQNLIAKAARPEIRDILAALYTRQEEKAQQNTKTIPAKEEAISRLKGLTALANAIGSGKQNTDDIQRLKAEIKQLADNAAPKPPGFGVVKAWRAADGIAFVAYATENFDATDSTSAVEIKSLTLNWHKIEGAKKSGAGFVALPTAAYENKENVTLRMEAIQTDKATNTRKTLHLKKTLTALPENHPVPDDLQKAVEQIRSIARGEIPPPDMLTQNQAEAINLLAARALQQKVGAITLPAVEDIKSEAQVAQAAATLKDDKTRSAYALLAKLKENNPTPEEAQTAMTAYQDAARKTLAAYALRDPKADPMGNVTVTTWAEPGMLLLDKKPISPEPKREGANLVFHATPGTREIAIPAENVAAASVVVPELVQPEIYTIAISQPRIEASLTEDTQARCTVTGGPSIGLTYKWKVSAGNKTLELPETQIQGKVVMLDTKTLQQVADAGGTAELTVEAYKNGNRVASSQQSTNLIVLQPKGMAFIVGIDEYQKNSLLYLSDDANDFAESLVKNFAYPRGNVYTVTARNGKITINDGQNVTTLPGLLTKDVLENEFNKFLDKAGKVGAKHFIIYYSGHGTANKDSGDDEMVMPEGNLNIPTHDWARRLLDNLPNKTNPVSNYTVIGLYQACRDNAPFRDDGDHIFGNDKAAKEKSVRYFALPSCAPNSESHVDVDQGPQAIGIKHGYFGKALLDALDILPKGVPVSATALRNDIDVTLRQVVIAAQKKTGDSTIDQKLPKTPAYDDLTAIYTDKK